MSLRWRRGGGITPTGGGAGIYGPTQGAATVRAEVGPRTVTNPGGGISFNSSGSLQTAINANPTGSTFVCSVNNPVWNSTVSTGTKAPTVIFPGTVGQVIIDGGFADRIAFQAGDGTTVKGGTWRNFGTSTFGDAFVTQDTVTIQDLVVHNCFEDGVSIQGLNNLISHCTLHTCGRKGIGTGNTGLGQTDGLVMEYCKVYGNNTRDLNGGGDASGSKFLFTGTGIFRNNHFHNNHGFGLWLDTDNFACLIEENVLEDNDLSGLMYEANYGSVIRHNYIANNGKNVTVGSAGTFVENEVNVRFSDNAAARATPVGPAIPVEFFRNIVDNTLFVANTGALILLWDHTDSTVRHCANHDIYENQFWLRDSTASRIRNTDNDLVSPFTTTYQLWDLDNHYWSNEYHVTSMATSYWHWGSGTSTGSAQSWAAWQAFHPGENIARVQI